jgi:shikimate dehydrogenase
LAQACNVLTFKDGQILADNTDGIGLVDDIERNAGVPLKGKRLLLLGAGGAAAGVLGPLINAQPAHISVANRTAHKAEVLVERHQSLASLKKTELIAHELYGLEGDFDVIINGTASSLGGDDVPVSEYVLKPGALAYDMMYGPGAIRFTTWAKQLGAVPRDGLGMLVEQAAEAFLIWRGVRPPSAQVLAELRKVVG